MAYRNHRNAASAPSIYQTVADRIILLPVWQSSSGCKRRCIEGMSTSSCRKPSTVLRQIGELDSVVGEHSVDVIRNGSDECFEEGSGRLHIGLFHEFDHGKLPGPVDGHKRGRACLRPFSLRRDRYGRSRSDRCRTSSSWGLSPSTSGSRLMPCRSRQRCSEERVNCGIVACDELAAEQAGEAPDHSRCGCCFQNYSN
jgi:hypothetical protein